MDKVVYKNPKDISHISIKFEPEEPCMLYKHFDCCERCGYACFLYPLTYPCYGN